MGCVLTAAGPRCQCLPRKGGAQEYAPNAIDTRLGVHAAAAVHGVVSTRASPAAVLPPAEPHGTLRVRQCSPFHHECAQGHPLQAPQEGLEGEGHRAMEMGAARCTGGGAYVANVAA